MTSLKLCPSDFFFFLRKLAGIETCKLQPVPRAAPSSLAPELLHVYIQRRIAGFHCRPVPRTLPDAQCITSPNTAGSGPPGKGCPCRSFRKGSPMLLLGPLRGSSITVTRSPSRTPTQLGSILPSLCRGHPGPSCPPWGLSPRGTPL